jgi:uncharacterized RDD family membrane protein YckC
MSLELEPTVAQGGGTFTDAGRPVRGGEGLQIGTMLAHFRIDALLGAGGMGEVYRATDLALDRPVALKVLPAAVAQDESRRDRLFREARAQARLQHPNVCHIYYVGVQDGVVFFAMELVAGETLAARLARGPIPSGEAIEMVRQAALGLREAQRHGFTHRDVKPSNLMVDHEGRVKVVDFGLVKVTDTPLLVATDGDPTRTGVVGTPLYMAPEQAAGISSDLRADIYALGATLHHLVSGRPPFDGDSQDVLLSRHRDSPRPRLEVGGKRVRALASIDAVCARMMAKRPDDRFASYDALLAELERISPSRTRPAGVFVRATALLIDLIVIALVVAIPVSIFEDQLGYELYDGNIILVGAGPPYLIFCTWRFGGTFGRWVLDLEVIAVNGLRRPSLWSSALRFLLEYGAVAAALILSMLDKLPGLEWLGPLSGFIAVLGVAIPLIELTRVSLMTPDKRPFWDRIAGTMVRYRTSS